MFGSAIIMLIKSSHGNFLRDLHSLSLIDGPEEPGGTAIIGLGPYLEDQWLFGSGEGGVDSVSFYFLLIIVTIVIKSGIFYPTCTIVKFITTGCA